MKNLAKLCGVSVAAVAGWVALAGDSAPTQPAVQATEPAAVLSSASGR